MNSVNIGKTVTSLREPSKSVSLSETQNLCIILAQLAINMKIHGMTPIIPSLSLAALLTLLENIVKQATNK